MSGKKQEFCDRLRIVRQQRGLSQAEAAAAIGRKFSDAWSRIERGTASSISFEMLLEIAQFCKDNGVSLDWLLLGENETRQGKVIRKHGFNYVDVAADRAFAETAEQDEIIVQLGRTIGNEKILQRLLKCVLSHENRRACVNELYGNERENNDRI